MTATNVEIKKKEGKCIKEHAARNHAARNVQQGTGRKTEGKAFQSLINILISFAMLVFL